MKKIFSIIAILCVPLFSLSAAGRKPPQPAQAQAIVQQAPPPDPIYQCPFCKRMFKLSEGKIIRFRVHDEEKVICADCFYESLEYTQKRFLHPEKK